MKKQRSTKKIICRIGILMITLSVLLGVLLSGGPGSVAAAQSVVSLFDGIIDTARDSFFDSSVIYALPKGVKDTDELSLIIEVNENSILDAFEEKNRNMTVSEFAYSDDAADIRARISEKKSELLKALDKAGVPYKTGADYATLLSGFEIRITAANFETVCKTFKNKANTYIGEVYNKADTKLVENDVDVYDTGIFDSSDCAYDGTGVVVAVLDTGLDYNHTAFSTKNFTADRSKLGMTFSEVAALISSTRASSMHAGLTASDVYLNDKIPFSFDYADEDPDVYPVDSDHGTHVAGIIAGKDDVITGVAPNAQLVIMKTFSDVKDSAYASWILSALEDCVVLGVDVINMSLGTPCGFSRESDDEMLSGVYDRIREQGISLVVAASNNYNSTYGSEKNGNLGLTSNPDSATVGSPSTYEGALSVSSVSGTKTPYILYGDKIIYFNESTDRIAEEKNFFEELLPEGTDSQTVEFVTIPGVGRSADYTGIDVTGKIALVARGSTTFEEKANTAEAKGAAGVIIYNNVSGDIKMNVGDIKIPACSISQDDGEMLAALGTGKITIARSQTSGPFMSDFSSWGPGPSLEIKPEITAHGGSIYSAVPGQSYDKISGTSMATPNISGVTALLRQYVQESFPGLSDDPVGVTALVNQLMMSSADILLAKNGLPYSVRKQGAGLANLDNCTATTAYIITYDRENGSEMDKSKIELGDDPDKNGVYTLKFAIKNFGKTALSYDLSTYVMTEGVSDTKTSRGETTVTEEGYILEGATVDITSVTSGTLNGQNVTVAAGQTATVTLTVTLSDSDKQYLDTSFENGMYVEGFVVLTATEGTEVSLSVPYLAFYGDWTEAPIFDLSYYDTNKDEIDNSIDPEDKTMADAYASRPIGGMYSDYVSYLGSYYFFQDPSATQIAADAKHNALSNQADTINSLRYVWAGLLRNCDKVVVTITDDVTGEVVFETVDEQIRKSYSEGGSIFPANVDIEFSAIDHALKNNTSYTVRLQAYTPYGDGGEANNDNNVFEFPIVADFEAPAVTDCEFYTEYDSSSKELRYYAKMSVYDNHYAMCLQPGYVGLADDGTGYILQAFDHYMTPVYSSFNSTSYVVYELTDYIDEIKKNATNRNTFTVACYDYALNSATYEIELPDEFLDLCFAEEEIVISPNELFDLSPLVYPDSEWSALLDYYCTVPASGEVARVVNNTLVGVAPGTARVIARDPVSKKQTTIAVTVLGEDDEGYKKYDKPIVDNFTLTGYDVDRAFYFIASEDRDIGLTGDQRKFVSDAYSLTLFPSEEVTLRYILDAFFPNDTEVVFESSNKSIVTVDENGKITAVAKGYGSISVRVLLDGKSTYYSKTISVEVKDPYVTNGSILTNYFGNGGKVELPKRLSLTEIGQYAFSNFEYIDKNPDEITKYEPESMKLWYIGDDTIEEVIIPEGVKTINAYAFANLTALKRVVLPSTLERIDQGAFYGCTSLVAVEGLENVKFLNRAAFYGCKLDGKISLDSAVAIADYAFAYNENLDEVTLSKVSQSVGAYAFAGCTSLAKLNINADFVKIGAYTFADCKALTEVTINTAVVSRGAFSGCSSLASINLGKDVAVLGEYAFSGTALTSFNIDASNQAFKANASYITNKEGTELVLVAPAFSGDFTLSDSKIVSIGSGAFSGCTKLTSITAPSVTAIGDYAFAGCTKLEATSFGALTEIGSYAFYKTALTAHPALSAVKVLGDYAFAGTALESVTIPSGMTVGKGAFSDCKSLHTVTIGNDVTIGDYAFYLDSDHNWTYSFYTVNTDRGTEKRVYYYVYLSPIESLSIGDNAVIGAHAFSGAAQLESITLGKNATIGEYAFYNNSSLKEIDLSAVVSIGANAFSGDVLFMANDSSWSSSAIDEDGNYIYSYHAADLTSVNLSALTSLGDYAFAYCRELKTVTLSDDITVIPEGAFNLCASLSSIDLSGITSIGVRAFEAAALTEIDLSSAETVGSYAFAYCDKLTSVTLKEGEFPVIEEEPEEEDSESIEPDTDTTADTDADSDTEPDADVDPDDTTDENGTEEEPLPERIRGTAIEEGAFAYCSALVAPVNVEFSPVIGDYAFAYTAITEIDLTCAESIGQHAFLKERATAFKVTLGPLLTSLGDNPFAYCILPAFSTEETVEFNGTEYKTEIYTYDISDSVCVIDGLLYRVVPNGLELISYAGDASVVTVAKDTVRISAMAFAECDSVTQTILPHTVAAIGHKAFYGCDALKVISFSSYVSPILEEEYDYMYFASGDHIPASGKYTFSDANGNIIEKEGIGIVDYFMWNAADIPTSTYYGASFVDYIGYVESKLTMIRPANGKNYDSFILAQYFDTVIDGAAAADSITLAAIKAIDLLPDTVSLADKPLVTAARAAYSLISTLEQRALVTNYAKLTQAEKRISDLEYLEKGDDTDDPGSSDTPKDEPLDPILVVILILSAVTGCLAVVVIVFAILLSKQRFGTSSDESAPTEETPTDSVDDTEKSSSEDEAASVEAPSEENATASEEEASDRNETVSAAGIPESGDITPAAESSEKSEITPTADPAPTEETPENTPDAPDDNTTETPSVQSDEV